MNFKQVMAIKNKHKERLLNLYPFLTEKSGIYILTRYENDFKYAYIGQAKHILTRLAEHLMGYEQWIDKSIRKHKLYNRQNSSGWNIAVFECEEHLLNEMETKYIKEYANKGYQLRNKTSGSQGVGKFGIADNKEAKGYRDGVKFGKEKCLKKIKEYFDKYLDFTIKGKTNKIKERKFEELKEILGGTDEN